MLNKLLCVLWAGGVVEFTPSAAPAQLWAALAQRRAADPPLTLFMGVPTVYGRMIELARQGCVPEGVLGDGRETLRRYVCGGVGVWRGVV